MRDPYAVMTRALVLLKAAGLRLPAATRNEKLRLLDIWVQRYGDRDATVFLQAAGKLAGGRYFPRFCDVDAALRQEELTLATARQAAAPVVGKPVDRAANKKRLHELIERLARRK